jgi:hypothetical protein
MKKLLEVEMKQKLWNEFNTIIIIIQWKIQEEQDKEMFTISGRNRESSRYIKRTTQVEAAYTNDLWVYGQKGYYGMMLYDKELEHLP